MGQDDAWGVVALPAPKDPAVSSIVTQVRACREKFSAPFTGPKIR
jgi:hypothetical protein